MLCSPQVIDSTELKIRPNYLLLSGAAYSTFPLHITYSQRFTLHLAYMLWAKRAVFVFLRPEILCPINYRECIVFKLFYHYEFKLTSSRVTIKVKLLGLSLPFAVIGTVYTVSCSLSPTFPLYTAVLFILVQQFTVTVSKHSLPMFCLFS